MFSGRKICPAHRRPLSHNMWFFCLYGAIDIRPRLSISFAIRTIKTEKNLAYSDSVKRRLQCRRITDCSIDRTHIGYIDTSPGKLITLLTMVCCAYLDYDVSKSSAFDRFSERVRFHLNSLNTTVQQHLKQTVSSSTSSDSRHLGVLPH